MFIDCLRFKVPRATHWMVLLTLSALPCCVLAGKNIEGGYQLPPPELQAVVDAPRGPQFKLGPQRKIALLINLPGLPSIDEVAQPELKLAGLRINPRTRAASRFDFSSGLVLLDIASGKSREVKGLPIKARIADTLWSADEQWVAFSRWASDGVELWLLDVKTATARRLMAEKLNAVIGSGFSWLSGSDQLLVRLLPRRPSKAPLEQSIPSGPNMQESKGGKVTQSRTYPDMLKTAYDADMLEWQLQTQLAIVKTSGELRRIGPVMPLSKVQPSPDGKLVLTTQVRRPYSTILPMERFGQLIEVWNDQGIRIKKIAERPMRERLPVGNDAVQAGPRDFGWRNDQAATLYWLEAQAGGDPEVNAKIHDVLKQQVAPFTAPAQELVNLPWRFNAVQWGNDGLALVTENWWKTRDTRTWRIQPGFPNSKPELIFNRKSEDQYANPGSPVMTQNQYGRSVLRTSADGFSIYLIGAGASAEGERPFLDKLHLPSEKTTRLWRSKAPYYEEVLGLLDEKSGQIVTSRASFTTIRRSSARKCSTTDSARPFNTESVASRER